jgi:uncharacterized membrane protein HdeD (DUF308 family)
MNDQNPTPNPSTPPPGPTDWRAQRRAERAARWGAHPMRRHNWLWGVLLILLGVIFLLQNLGIPFLTNWWALFILIPAFWSYVAAWDSVQENSRLTRRAASSLTVALILTILAVVLLLGWQVGLLWPIFLIVGGLALLLTGLLPE